jgi:hypothetical protein
MTAEILHSTSTIDTTAVDAMERARDHRELRKTWLQKGLGIGAIILAGGLAALAIFFGSSFLLRSLNEVYIPGPQGIEGKAGETGKQGEPGVAGPAGKDGRDGMNGKDGRDATAQPVTPWSNPANPLPNPPNLTVNVQNFTIFNEDTSDAPRFRVVTGWIYDKATDTMPSKQHCYISKPPVISVQIALNGKPERISDQSLAQADLTRSDISTSLLKCQWFNGVKPSASDLPPPPSSGKPTLKF